MDDDFDFLQEEELSPVAHVLLNPWPADARLASSDCVEQNVSSTSHFMLCRMYVRLCSFCEPQCRF